MYQNILTTKTKAFVLQVIQLFQVLQSKWEFIFSKQIFRSGTSIWVNVSEATAGESKRDFYAKICISFKESYETLYWIELLQKWNLTKIDLSNIKNKCDELIKMLASTKITSEQNMNYQK